MKFLFLLLTIRKMETNDNGAIISGFTSRNEKTTHRENNVVAKPEDAVALCLCSFIPGIAESQAST